MKWNSPYICNALSLPQKSMVPLTYPTYNPCSLNQLISWHILLLLSIPNSMVLLTYVTFHYCPLPQPQNQWFSWHMLPTINAPSPTSKSLVLLTYATYHQYPLQIPGYPDIICYLPVCQWLAAGQWFSPGILVSSTNKTDCHYITEILLKMA